MKLKTYQLSQSRLEEGREFRVFSAQELLSQHRVVPYDAFAVWLNATRPIID